MCKWNELPPEKYYGLPAKTNYDKKMKTKILIESDNYVASLKKDGQWHRYIKGTKTALLQSRGTSVKTGTYGEFQDWVPHIMAELDKLGNKNVFIGELYRPDWTTNQVGSILRCLPAKAIERQKDSPLIYYIFDVYCYNGDSQMETPMIDRVEKLKLIKEKVKELGLKYVQVADYVTDVNGIKGLLDYVRLNDEEGIVMTLKPSIPVPGARTAWKTLKIKKEFDNAIDVFLTGISKPATREYTGKDVETCQYWENVRTGEKLQGLLYKDYVGGSTIEPISKTYFMGLPGSLEIAVYDKENDKVVSMGWISGLTEELKKNFIEDTEAYTNHVCKVTAMELTDDQKLRHPKFMGLRNDIDWTDCTLDKIFETI